MYRIYEKVPKNPEYEYGLKLLDKSENPFNSPCIVSMIAITMWEKEINGALNQAMEALRLKTNHNDNSGLELEEFSGRILSISYGEPSENITIKGRKISDNISLKKELDYEFAQKYLFPLIEEDNHKIAVISAMMNMRNVNFLAYCGATQSVLNMEECLSERMIKLGYEDQEINQILSQICLICYATDVKLQTEFVKKKEIKSTCVSFGDVNDGEVGVSEGTREKVKEEGSLYYDEGYYFHYGNGEHTLKKYINQDISLSAGISNAISKALSNSIANFKTDDFIPLTKEIITEDLEAIIECLKQGKTKEKIMSIVEEKINYGQNRNLNVGDSQNPSSPKF